MRPTHIDLGEPDIDAPMKRGWCPVCEANVDVRAEDHGIGSYEYWGSVGVHTDIQDTCTECGSTGIECERNEEEDFETEA